MSEFLDSFDDMPFLFRLLGYVVATAMVLAGLVILVAFVYVAVRWGVVNLNK